jgi:hypothetical protein
MGTTRCRNGDGDCSYSDRALLMVNGRLSVITGETAERLFPVDAAPYDLELLETAEAEAYPYEWLVDLVLEARRAESPRDGTFADEVSGRLASMEDDLARASNDDWLIVYCTPCGHVWRKRIP